MTKIAFQDCYIQSLSHCYGCGKSNPDGHQLKSYWLDNYEGSKTIAHFTPKPYHTAIPGFVYGGLLASLIDCHGTGSAAAVVHYKNNLTIGSVPTIRFVTAALNINYLAPTPIDNQLELVGEFSQVKDNKVIVDITLSANNVMCAKGEVIAVKMPVTFL
ncbi:PaaI family thioesterase [Pseudoalteromonas sp. Angola-7]|jgi:acyl-coenzyme A thioesterase PaaI-like protein|uniref:PaaI family thioesterase n=1 Tax=Pseudoalteromonas sp. Angola-7 TaxID=3025336 RepID=UPI002358DD6F|nr:PaaI family thioesterase [Pseudoalteromonas sp. Angola-7]MDC9529028.1 PaaI family thioesterase [Pseudoalteromonas sp. Angola-7]